MGRALDYHETAQLLIPQLTDCRDGPPRENRLKIHPKKKKHPGEKPLLTPLIAIAL